LKEGKKMYLMSTADAIKIVNSYGSRNNLPGFLECMESLTVVCKLPRADRRSLVRDHEVEAFHVVIGEMQAFTYS
jgi:hypothetical protein